MVVLIALLVILHSKDLHMRCMVLRSGEGRKSWIPQEFESVVAVFS